MRLFRLAALVFVSALLATAGSVNVGALSFDVFLPGTADAPGVNMFSIANLTGDPSLGGFALPPDFPVLSFLTLTNVRLVVSGDLNQQFDLGDLAPGIYTPTTLQFPSTTVFKSAVLTAAITPQSLNLSTASTPIFVSGTVVASLLSTSGLDPGNSTALLQLSDVPEPSFALPMLIALVGLPIVRARTRR